MTETSDHAASAEALPQAIEAFILQWGDLGGQWGTNRSVSQIHACLYLSERPLTAEDIAARLGMARSNVSTSLRELMTWNLVRRVPVRGDRRDFFEAETDLWEIAARIAAGRKAREIDPALAALRACVGEADRDPAVHPVARERLHAMLDFTAAVDRWYQGMAAVPKSKRDVMLRLGAKIASFLPKGREP
jgi:DNA-binding transcriptional regulator GbsR (MarR family)